MDTAKSTGAAGRPPPTPPKPVGQLAFLKAQSRNGNQGEERGGPRPPLPKRPPVAHVKPTCIQNGSAEESETANMRPTLPPRQALPGHSQKNPPPLPKTPPRGPPVQPRPPARKSPSTQASLSAHSPSAANQVVQTAEAGGGCTNRASPEKSETAEKNHGDSIVEKKPSPRARPIPAPRPRPVPRKRTSLGKGKSAESREQGPSAVNSPSASKVQIQTEVKPENTINIGAPNGASQHNILIPHVANNDELGLKQSTKESNIKTVEIPNISCEQDLQRAGTAELSKIQSEEPEKALINDAGGAVVLPDITLTESSTEPEDPLKTESAKAQSDLVLDTSELGTGGKSSSVEEDSSQSPVNKETYNISSDVSSNVANVSADGDGDEIQNDLKDVKEFCDAAPGTQDIRAAEQSTSDTPANTVNTFEAPTDSVNISETLADTVETSEILADTVEISETPAGSVEISETPADTVETSETPADTVEISETPAGSVEISETHADTVEIPETPADKDNIINSDITEHIDPTEKSVPETVESKDNSESDVNTDNLETAAELVQSTEGSALSSENVLAEEHLETLQDSEKETTGISEVDTKQTADSKAAVERTSTASVETTSSNLPGLKRTESLCAEGTPTSADEVSPIRPPRLKKIKKSSLRARSEDLSESLVTQANPLSMWVPPLPGKQISANESMDLQKEVEPDKLETADEEKAAKETTKSVEGNVKSIAAGISSLVSKGLKFQIASKGKPQVLPKPSQGGKRRGSKDELQTKSSQETELKAPEVVESVSNEPALASGQNAECTLISDAKKSPKIAGLGPRLLPARKAPMLPPNVKARGKPHTPSDTSQKSNDPETPKDCVTKTETKASPNQRTSDTHELSQAPAGQVPEKSQAAVVRKRHRRSKSSEVILDSSASDEGDNQQGFNARNRSQTVEALFHTDTSNGETPHRASPDVETNVKMKTVPSSKSENRIAHVTGIPRSGKPIFVPPPPPPYSDLSSDTDCENVTMTSKIVQTAIDVRDWKLEGEECSTTAQDLDKRDSAPSEDAPLPPLIPPRPRKRSSSVSSDEGYEKPVPVPLPLRPAPPPPICPSAQGPYDEQGYMAPSPSVKNKDEFEYSYADVSGDEDKEEVVNRRRGSTSSKGSRSSVFGHLYESIKSRSRSNTANREDKKVEERKSVFYCDIEDFDSDPPGVPTAKKPESQKPPKTPPRTKPSVSASEASGIPPPVPQRQHLESSAPRSVGLPPVPPPRVKKAEKNIDPLSVVPPVFSRMDSTSSQDSDYIYPETIPNWKPGDTVDDGVYEIPEKPEPRPSDLPPATEASDGSEEKFGRNSTTGSTPGSESDKSGDRPVSWSSSGGERDDYIDMKGANFRIAGHLQIRKNSSAWSDVSAASSAPSESELDSDAEEKEKEKKPRDNGQKVFLIAQEIMTTERTFVEVLKLINIEFRKSVDKATERLDQAVVPPSVMNQILKYLPQLQSFNEELLKDITNRINKWESNPKIADIFVRKGPFLKLYTSYIREFESATMLLDDACSKYPEFQKVVREFESEQCRSLALKHYMLKPIQRIPQYRLLLQDYLKHLNPDSVDFKDTITALAIVSEVANHANQSMKYGDNFKKLLEVQNSLIGQFEVVKPGRGLLKDGELMKYSRKDMQPRQFFLFNDVLLYTTPVSGGFRLNNTIPLTGMKVSQPTHEEFQNEFSIVSTHRSFKVSASTPQERDDWLKALQEAIDENVQKRISFNVDMSGTAMSQANYENDKDFKLGSRAPVWIPDARVSMCMLCTAEFTVTFRRHHCRACGKVVCGLCSDYRAALRYLKLKPDRVCRECHNKLNGGTDETQSQVEQVDCLKELDREQLHRDGSIVSKLLGSRFPSFGKGSRKRPAVLTEVAANDETVDMSGYLKLWQPKSRKWKKLWFALKGKALYTFKASEDTAAMESRVLLGYEVHAFRQWFEDKEPNLVFELAHKGTEPMIFRTESPSARERWMNAMRDATIP